MTEEQTFVVPPKKKCLIIVNPCAGRKKGLKALPKIHKLFTENGYSVVDHVTSSRGEGGEYTKAAEGFDLIVAVGGDGTLNEVIDGVLKSGKTTPIGYIPAGSTNDFARSLGIPYKPVKAAKQILTEPPRKLDIGRYGDRCFNYVASFGIFTGTSYSAPQKLKNAIGHLAYILHGVKELARIRPITVEFVTPNGETVRDEFIYGSFSNSTSFGGVLKLNPADVSFDDGKFELMLIRIPRTPRQLSRCLHALAKQKPYDSTQIVFFHTDKITLTFPKEAPFSLDGEFAAGAKEIEIGVLPGAVTMLGCRPKEPKTKE